MRQISAATFLYAADNGGFAPNPRKGSESTYVSSSQSVWRDGFFVARSHDSSDSTYAAAYPKGKWFAEYFGGPNGGGMHPVAYCPAGGRFGDVGPNLSSGIANSPYPNHSYMINTYLANPSYFTGDPVTGVNMGAPYNNCIPLAQFSEPGKVCLWIEGLQNTGWPNNANVSGPHFAKSRQVRQEGTPVVGGKPIYQMFGKANVVYLDQHIAAKKIPEELPSKSSDSCNMNPNITEEIKYKFWTNFGRGSNALDDPHHQ